MRFLPLLCSLFLLAGCANTYQVTRADGSPASSLDRNATAYIAVPPDGRYGQTIYGGSGGMTAQAIAVAFGPYLKEVVVSPASEDIDAARASARRGGRTYLIFPRILHWEDRATEWSGIPDRISVKVSILDVDSGAVLDSAVVSGKSRLMTFGGDRPEDLLAKALADYVSAVFGMRRS